MRRTASSALGHSRETNAFAPGTRYSSKKGPRSGPAPAALAMWGRPIASAAPAFATAASKLTSTPCSLSLPMIVLARFDALLLSAVASRLDLLQVDPVAADVEVLGVAVHARHLDRGNVLDPELGGGPRRLEDAGDAVVVGERHHRDAGLVGGADHVGRFELAVGNG